ncbi:MAG: hypothetical protein ABEJ68_05300 [Halobacteriaceae archaeon]
MPSTRRRTFLATLGGLAAGSTAGCSLLGSEERPAGTLVFANDDSLPHAVSMRVTGVGAEPGDGDGTVTGTTTVPPAQRSLTATTTLDPDESDAYRGTFTHAAWYAVAFRVDGRQPENGTGTVTFNPRPAGEERGRTLTARVHESGDFTWAIGTTGDLGPFE